MKCYVLGCKEKAVTGFLKHKTQRLSVAAYCETHSKESWVKSLFPKKHFKPVEVIQYD